MMGGSLIPGLFAPLMNAMSEDDRRSLARQMSQQQAQAFNRFTVLSPAPIISTGPGLLPKDLIPDLETAADIPSRIARMVETLIDSRKPKPAQRQWGMQQAFVTAMTGPGFLRNV